MENTSTFFSNKQCRYYPCHKGITEINCLFCYCPLYNLDNCPGNKEYVYKEDGRIIKKCTECTFPHKIENYERIISILRTNSLKSVNTSTNLYKDFKHGGQEVFNPIREKHLIDFSVNVNPLGIPHNVKVALKKNINSFSSYPDYDCAKLKNAISIHHNINEQNIICTNGASEGISIIIQSVNPSKALILAPTFSGYEKALLAFRCNIHTHQLLRENDFCVREDLLISIKEVNPDIVFICNPSNPIGNVISKPLLISIADLCKKQNCILVVDECFLDFCKNSKELSMQQEILNYSNLIIIKAFTKIYALAGLRLGYIFCSNQNIIKKMHFIQSEWAVSLPAQIAGINALKNRKYIEKTHSVIEKERTFLVQSLRKLGFNVLDGEANYIFFSSTHNIYNDLLKRNICIRECSSYDGLTENDYRIAIKTHDENKRLIKALEEILLK